MYIRLQLLVFIALGILGCTQHAEPPNQTSHGFYFWKQRFTLTNTEQIAVKTLKASKMYVKFFDVSQTRSGVLPIADVEFDTAIDISAIEIIPTVFITEEALALTEDHDIDSLARRILAKILRMAKANDVSVHEVQLDCDWSQRTRSKYFRLLSVIGRDVKEHSITLSATIRLHQIKYREKTGVPPVDRGMLMVYNMADWKKEETNNSIFDKIEAEKYVNFVKDYPLSLDIALPIFHWSLVYRGDRFLAILGGVDRGTLKQNNALQDNGSRFSVLRDTFAYGAQLRAGDAIRPEECDVDDVADIAERLQKLLPKKNRNFVLYHLDSAILAHYTNEELNSLFPH